MLRTVRFRMSLTRYQTNKYLQHSAVWDLVKSEDPAARALVPRVIFTCSESIRITAILLQPFMPSKMKTCLDWLGVEEANRTFVGAQFGADYKYGVPFADPGKAGSTGTLFPPLTSEW